MIIKKAAVEFEGNKIGGYFYIPGEGKYPCVILVQGFGGGTFEKSKADLCMDLCRRGMCCFFFDFYSYSGGLSNFSAEDMTLSFQVAALKVVVEFAARQEFVKGKRIAIVGHSLGGLTAYMYAADNDTLRGVCVLGAVSDVRWCLENVMGNLSEWYEKGYKEFSWEGEIVKVKWDFVADARKIMVMENLARIRCKVAIIHGDADKVVPLVQAQDQHKAIEGSNLVIIRGAGHSFSGPFYEMMENAVGEFLVGVLMGDKRRDDGVVAGGAIKAGVKDGAGVIGRGDRADEAGVFAGGGVGGRVSKVKGSGGEEE